MRRFHDISDQLYWSEDKFDYPNVRKVFVLHPLSYASSEIPRAIDEKRLAVLYMDRNDYQSIALNPRYLSEANAIGKFILLEKLLERSKDKEKIGTVRILDKLSIKKFREEHCDKVAGKALKYYKLYHQH